ncbi:MAG: hypothetical protein J2P37_02055 [Ktedonobacteraceae bacterium]|nr:hypothetical protein [Ktedonobacteraceae bacterium]
MHLPEENVGLQEEEKDWEITPEGLYIATRGYLMRRGYCCANRCRNCPYINWRYQTSWKPIPIERARRTRVSTRSVAGAQERLSYHQQQRHMCAPDEQGYHQRMIEYYCALLERWGARV